MSYLVRGPHDSSAIAKALNEVENGPDRSVAVVGGSFIEAALTTAIRTALHQDDKTQHELFRASGAIGSFSAKISIGRLIGLYGPEAHKELDTIKDIRNSFAHKVEVQDFTNQRMRDLANNLRLCEHFVDGTLAINGLGLPDPERKNRFIERENWTPDPRKEEHLKSPRGRYILSVQLFLNVFGHVHKRRMPEPMI